MIHRFPRLWALFFDRSSQERGEWADALRSSGVADWFDEAGYIDPSAVELFG